MSDDVIRRVAKAIMGHMFAEHELPITNPWLLERYHDCARAAIEAMREPSLTMVKAGMDYRLHTSISGDNDWLSDTDALWRTMIDAALSPEVRETK